jgi:hypothetical protein
MAAAHTVFGYADGRPIALSPSEKLKLFQSCAQSAEHYFKSEPEWKQSYDYTSHYNLERSRCFIMIETGDTQNVRDAVDRANIASRWITYENGRQIHIAANGQPKSTQWFDDLMTK